jgi:hypothetical protein
MRLSETLFDNAPAEVQEMTEALIRQLPSAEAAILAMIDRGMTMQQGKDEDVRVIRGCVWERQRGMPLRMDAAFDALGKGRKAAELFPDDLYSSEWRKPS